MRPYVIKLYQQKKDKLTSCCRQNSQGCREPTTRGWATLGTSCWSCGRTRCVPLSACPTSPQTDCPHLQELHKTQICIVIQKYLNNMSIVNKCYDFWETYDFDTLVKGHLSAFCIKRYRELYVKYIILSVLTHWHWQLKGVLLKHNFLFCRCLTLIFQSMFALHADGNVILWMLTTCPSQECLTPIQFVYIGNCRQLFVDVLKDKADIHKQWRVKLIFLCGSLKHVILWWNDTKLSQCTYKITLIWHSSVIT